jgi:hypothetical protein
MTRKPKELTRNEGWYKLQYSYHSFGKDFVSNVTVDVSGYLFDNLCAEMKRIESEYKDQGEKFKIEHETFYHPYDPVESSDHFVYVWRKENDEEFAARCATQVKHETQMVDRERAEYERLAKKFGSK